MTSDGGAGPDAGGPPAMVLPPPLGAYHVAPAPQQTFRGWGVSLAWEGNMLYGSSLAQPFSTDPAFPGKVIDLLYGDPSSRLTLGLNIARYNIGGGDGSHRHMSPTAQMETFQDSAGAAFDFTRDAGQRRLLQEAKERGADLFEAFANSPPHWMTISGCAAGGATGGENLAPAHDADYIKYLVTTVAHFKTAEGITFESLEPFNEPDGPWWKSGGHQEGFFAAPATQNRVIPGLAKALTDAGLATFVSAADDNNLDHMTQTLASYGASTLAGIGRINTHSYNGSNRWALRTRAAQLGKPLWMSEVGCCIGGGGTNVHGEPNDHTSIWGALWMADTIRQDLRDMNARAWVFWQADWNVIAFADGHTPKPLKQYYAMAQYTDFIRPGFQVIAVDAPDTLAAYSAASHRLVLVATNWDSSKPVDYDLGGFSGTTTATVVRTTADADTNLAPQPDIAIDADRQLVDTLPVRSVTTYVVNGVTPIAPETGFTGALRSHDHPDLCLTVANNAHGPTAAAIQLATCQDGLDAQRFTYDPATGHVTVFAGAQEMCLNVWGAVAKNGAQLGTWACEDVANERFSFTPATGQLRMWNQASGAPGSCVNLIHHQFTAGANLYMFDCSGTPDTYQTFDATP